MNMVPTTFIRANRSHLVQNLALQTKLAQIAYMYTPKIVAPKHHRTRTPMFDMVPDVSPDCSANFSLSNHI